MSRIFVVSASLTMVAALLSVSSLASAGPIVVLGVDIDGDPSPTQSTFSGFGTPAVAGTNRDFNYTGLSLAYTQTGTVNVKVDTDNDGNIEGRDRGAITESGSFTQSNLYRDFLQQSSANRYLDIIITGLLANHAYDVKFWAYDDDVTGVSNKIRFSDSTPGGSGNNGVILWGGGAVTANDQYSVMVSGVSDATGLLKFNAHVLNDAEDPGSGNQDLAKFNGLQISTIPEPSSLVLLGFLAPALASVIRRRRFALQAVAAMQH